MNDHTYLLAEATWKLSGSTIDVASNPNIAIGLVVVSRSGELIIVEQQVNELQSRYTVLPIETGAAATAFSGVNGVMGELKGSYAFFEDVILCTYASADGRFNGVETLLVIGASSYQVRGALFSNDGHVSSWSYALERA